MRSCSIAQGIISSHCDETLMEDNVRKIMCVCVYIYIYIYTYIHTLLGHFAVQQKILKNT